MKNFKLKHAKIYLSAIIAVIIALIIIFAAKTKSEKTLIYFYGIPEQTVKILQKELKPILEKNEKIGKTEFKILDSEKPLSVQSTKKAQAVITMQGAPAQNLIKQIGEKQLNKLDVSPAVTKDFTLSVSQAVNYTSKNKISALPILCDNVELSLEKTHLQKNPDADFSTIAKFESYIKPFAQQQSISTVAFAGADPLSFLNLITVLTETYEGKAGVEKASDIILKSKNGKWNFDALIYADDAPLYPACNALSRWSKENFIRAGTFKFTKKTVENLMAQKEAAAVFMTLSDRRSVQQQKIVTNYITVPESNDQKTPFIPSTQNLTNRSCVTPIICIIPTGRKAAEICSTVVSENAQSSLSIATGLAPVHKQAKTPDSQADDVRFWIATTNAPVIPLGYSAFMTEADRKDFSEKLINEILNFK